MTNLIDLDGVRQQRQGDDPVNDELIFEDADPSPTDEAAGAMEALEARVVAELTAGLRRRQVLFFTLGASALGSYLYFLIFVVI